MRERLCPKCDDPLSKHGVCGSCGYGRKERITRTVADPMRNRCSWYSNDERCRYIGSLAHSAASDKHYPDLFCGGHFQCSDPAHGQRIVDESLNNVPGDFDYSSEAIVAAARQRFKDSTTKPTTLTDEKRAEVEQKWPQLALLRPSEEDAERAAIEGE